MILGYKPGPTCLKCGRDAGFHYDRWDEGNPFLLRVECTCGYSWTRPTLDAPLRTGIEPRPGLPEFVKFQKIPRLRRPFYVTEKIDGTNAHVHVLEDGRVLAASRNRYITPAEDNHGFAKWVQQHEDELREGLGVGRHYGEWWGQGINRGYGLTERRFSLFNVDRWGEGKAPKCCHVVPTLLRDDVFMTAHVLLALADLGRNGSKAAPGFLKPEGIVVFHVAANAYFKVTLENDAVRKGEQ